MSKMTNDDLTRLQSLAGAGDMVAKSLLDHEAEITAMRKGKEGNFLVCRMATTDNINLATTGLTALDGVTPVAGNLVLVKNQTTSAENGVYVASAGAWKRLKDGNNQDVLRAGLLITVAEGTTLADTMWMLTTNDPIVAGTTTPLTFAQQTVSGVSTATLAAVGGAALVGIEDTATLITGTTVETALAELALAKSKLALTTNGNGASLIGIEDALALLAAGNVEAALAELAKYVPIALADPGTGVAIPVTRSASIAITTAAAETNTLDIPSFIGQKLILTMDVRAVGDRVITSAQRINQAANTIMTFGAVGDSITLEAVQVGGALRWQVTSNDGVALS